MSDLITIRGARTEILYVVNAQKLILERAVSLNVNLAGARLDCASLAGASLENARLAGAFLRNASLRGAYMDGADLRGADLSGADMRGAVLYGANLHNANLRGADLQHANLASARLKGADFTGATLNGGAVSQGLGVMRVLISDMDIVVDREGMQSNVTLNVWIDLSRLEHVQITEARDTGEPHVWKNIRNYDELIDQCGEQYWESRFDFDTKASRFFDELILRALARRGGNYATLQWDDWRDIQRARWTQEAARDERGE